MRLPFLADLNIIVNFRNTEITLNHSNNSSKNPEYPSTLTTTFLFQYPCHHFVGLNSIVNHFL